MHKERAVVIIITFTSTAYGLFQECKSLTRNHTGGELFLNCETYSKLSKCKGPYTRFINNTSSASRV